MYGDSKVWLRDNSFIFKDFDHSDKSILVKLCKNLNKTFIAALFTSEKLVSYPIIIYNSIGTAFYPAKFN